MANDFDSGKLKAFAGAVDDAVPSAVTPRMLAWNEEGDRGLAVLQLHELQRIRIAAEYLVEHLKANRDAETYRPG